MLARKCKYLLFYSSIRLMVFINFLFALVLSSCGYFRYDVASSVNVSQNPNATAQVTEPLKLTLSNATLNTTEGQTIQFIVTLNRASETDITFNYSAQDQTAVSSLDFPSTQGQVVIPAGQTQVTISIPTLPRIGFQGDRNFDLAITNVTGTKTSIPDIKEPATIKEAQINPGMIFDLNKIPEQVPVATFSGFIYFVRYQKALGYELWKTNGTTTSLVKDINPGELSAFDVGSHSAHQFLEMNGYLYFGANQKDYGFELWRTDGTDTGTTLVKDIYPGVNSGLSTLDLMAVYQNKLYFTAQIDSFYQELYTTDGTAAGTAKLMTSQIYSSNTAYWGGKPVEFAGKLFFPGYWDLTWDRLRVLITDGTEAGTSLLKDTNTVGWHLSEPQNLTVCNGKLFFGTSDSYNETPTGDELWVSNGTTATTTIVKDIVAGAGSSYARPVACLNNKLLFTATTSGSGSELWSTDGTSANTSLLIEINPGSISTSFTASHGSSDRKDNFIVINNILYFYAQTTTAGYELWKSDGTAVGTIMVKDIFPGAQSSWPHNFRDVDGQLAFVANDGTHGLELWQSDGTSAGTVLVKDINPGPLSSAPDNLVVLPAPLGNPSKLFMMAYSATNENPIVYWSQLTPESTIADPTIESDSEDSFPSKLFVLGQKLFFFASNGEWGNQLWETDGTLNGTKVLTDLYPNSGCLTLPLTSYSTANDIRYFIGEDEAHGQELWRTDGTPSGTYMIKDIFPGSSSSGLIFFANSDRKLADGRYLFAANDGTNGTELWLTDLTTAGTTLLLNTDPSTTVRNDAPTNITNIGGGKSLFWWKTPTYGNELWITDGTSAGTQMVKDINPGTADSYYSTNSTPIPTGSGRWMFVAKTAANGLELWSTDGTTAGTSILKDIYAGVNHGISGNELIPLNGKWFFTGNTAANGLEPYVTDGTSVGTVLLKDIYAGATGSSPSILVTLDTGEILFRAGDATTGTELWKTDGTSAGTIRLLDIEPGAGSSYPTSFYKVANGRWVFTASSTANGNELWSTDGTTVSLVKDTEPGASSGIASSLYLINGKVIFVHANATNDETLWISDGTSVGTQPLKDLNGPSTGSINFSYKGMVGQHLLFLADDGIHGSELWSSNGTDAGTRLELDLNPGSLPYVGSISEMTEFMGGIFFTASVPLRGLELFVIYPP